MVKRISMPVSRTKAPTYIEFHVLTLVEHALPPRKNERQIDKWNEHCLNLVAILYDTENGM